MKKEANTDTEVVKIRTNNKQRGMKMNDRVTSQQGQKELENIAIEKANAEYKARKIREAEEKTNQLSEAVGIETFLRTILRRAGFS